MNRYENTKIWLDTVHERLLLGIKIYGADSEFMGGYASRCITMNKDDINTFFDEWGLHTRCEKLKRIKTKIKHNETK